MLRLCKIRNLCKIFLNFGVPLCKTVPLIAMTNNWIFWCYSTFGVVLMILLVNGDDFYSNSHISPSSSLYQLKENNEKSSNSKYFYTNVPVIDDNVKKSNNENAEPSAMGDIFEFKNIEETFEDNKVDNFKETKVMKPTVVSAPQLSASSKIHNSTHHQAKSLREPFNLESETTLMKETVTPPTKGRQATSDIHEIITGIVKLLNGNVNVQANNAPVMGRPLRPLSTRINNRGPPRITDLPALPPDFDIPTSFLPPPLKEPIRQKPMKMPTPYPFDIPSKNSSPLRPTVGALFNEKPNNPNKMHYNRPIPLPINNLPVQMPMNKRPNKIQSSTKIPQVEATESTMVLSSETSAIMSNTNTMETEATTENPSDVQQESDETSKVEKKKPTKKDKFNKSTSSSEKIKSIIIETSSTITEIKPSQAPVLDVTETLEIKPTSTVVQDSSTNVLPSSGTGSAEVLSSDSVVESSLQDHFYSKESTTPAINISSTPTLVLTSSEEIRKSSMAISESSSTKTVNDVPKNDFSYPYRPRPGIVLDDTEYKPAGVHKQQVITRPPVGDVFDIVVSAIQGPGGSGSGQGKPFVLPVDIEHAQGTYLETSQDVITSPNDKDGFVSIDGKRTYLNLFNNVDPTATPGSPSAHHSAAKPLKQEGIETSFGVSGDHNKIKQGTVQNASPPQRRPFYGRPKPTHPPVRIDTCIVGDDSTCDVSQHEMCRTEAGVSACHCRPGHARRKLRDPCRRIVSILLSLRADRVYKKKIVWESHLADKQSEDFQQLSFESERAIESAMSMTPFSDEFLRAHVNRIYNVKNSAGSSEVFVNLTLQLEENGDTARPTVIGDIEKHLLGVIRRRSNNVGDSALWVDNIPGSVSNLKDLDECASQELHDCHSLATCINVFGGFKCVCQEGFRDQWADNKYRAGRECQKCSSAQCNNRGECKYVNGQEVCVCSGNYYGNQCELDGEVLGVVIGASVAAVIIIGLTLVCLVMWSRRWSREQKAAVCSPVFGYMGTTAKSPIVGNSPYHLTAEDRIRWAQIADVLTQANHYAPEPVQSRPPSMFGYPTLSMSGTLQAQSMHGTLPPVPLPRLNLQAQLARGKHGMRQFDNSGSSEEDDLKDVLERNYQTRPKSRSNASITNQSQIYYDVDYDQQDTVYKPSGNIPMSIYSMNMNRQNYFRK